MNNPMLIAALVCGGVGCFVVMIAMATPGWATGGDLSVGLFTVCGSLGCASYSAEGANAAAKAFVVIAFLLSLVALIDSLVYFCRYVKKDVANRNLPLIAAICYLVAAGLAILGAIIFAAKALEDISYAVQVSLSPGYSFALCIVGGLICVASGALTLVHRKQSG